MSGTLASIAAEATTIWSGEVIPLPSCGNSPNSAPREIVELGGQPPRVEAAVRSGDGGALSRQDHRERHHSRAADADEEVRFAVLHGLALSAV